MNFFKRKPKHEPETKPVSITGSKIALERVFIDDDGDEWFQYVNIMTIPARRAIAAEIATRFAEMNMTNESLTVFIESMKKAANNGNIVELFHLLSEIEFRLSYIGEENTLIELAACYFVLNGEDETDFSDVWKNKKIEKIKSNGRSKDFFLQRAFVFTTKYSELSDNDIHVYLKANAPSNERFNQILRRLKLGDTLTKSIMSTK
jgi:hypothetical protein